MDGTILKSIGVSKHYGTQDVLRDVSLEIQAGEKVGLVGRNGAGKTTLLRLLLGLEEPSAGNLILAAGARCGYVPQRLDLPLEETVESWLLAPNRAAETALRAAEGALAEAGTAGQRRAMNAYQAALDRFEAAGGHEARERTERLLDGLGLPGRMEQRIQSLSGGERNVLTLAQALSGNPDLLVLDEPGNHLDYAGLAWLERYLADRGGALLLVSHDRHLLDGVVGRIVDLEDGRVKTYTGNYSHYRMQKLRGLLAQQADYNANQRRLERLEELVKRFEEYARRTADPAWGKRLRARRSQLERERRNAVDRPVLDRTRIHLELAEERTKADIALQVRGYTRGYGDRVLFRDAVLDIACGERVALVGPNGSGKTTFLRDLVDRGSWDDSTIRVGPSLTVGYCAQNQETLPEDKTILDLLLSAGVRTPREALEVAGGVLFGFQDLDRRVGNLSGGEKNRLQLACLGVRGATFLVLDEPTNHMDIPAREVIEETLSTFAGTILVVSHDRYFLDKIATAVVEVRDGGFHRYPGEPLEFWQAWSAARASTQGRLATRARERVGAAPAAGDSPVGVVREIERRIQALETEKAALERSVADAFEQGRHQEGRQMSRRQERVLKLLDDLYRQWEEAERA